MSSSSETSDRSVVIPATGLVPGRVFSPAIRAGNLLFVSGQTGSDPVTREIRDGIEAQVEQAIRNIFAILESAGSGPHDIAKMTVYLTDIERDFGSLNKIFSSHFPVAPPARSTVGVAALARPGLLVEMDAIAVPGSGAGTPEQGRKPRE